MNGIMYVLSTGCQWRAIPKDLPPRSTVHDYLDLWSYDGTLDRIHHALYVECRERGKREASPTAAIIDSQSVKSAEKGGPVSIRMALMRARRSKARSATFCRYAGFVAPRHRSPRRYPGSRRRYPASCHSVRDVSVLEEAICRRRYQDPNSKALTKLLANAKLKSPLRHPKNEHLECDDGAAVFHHACKMGLEGIVSKRRDSTYRSGRSCDWPQDEEPGLRGGEAQEDLGR